MVDGGGGDGAATLTLPTRTLPSVNAQDISASTTHTDICTPAAMAGEEQRGWVGGLQRASTSINFSGTDTTVLHVPFLFRIKNAIARASNKHGQENAHERNERFEVHGDRAKEEEEEEDIFTVKHS